jgi:N-acetyl-1-D-myo-inositol-2-amino-2-deoxy-alpha-D-glucopyranoside deacetylase
MAGYLSRANEVEKRKVLLAVYAHPDDESFATGGTLARYAAEGGHVALICATRGEAGEISDSTLATPERLGEVREEELRCAAGILGVTDIYFLGYRDSGMAGSPANEDLRCLYQADPNVVTGQVVRVIRQVRPQVVITFEPGGGYGHPDHIAIHKATVAAYAAASDPNQYPEHLESGLIPHRPQKLYYTVLPRRFFQGIAELLRTLGVEPPHVGDRQYAERGIDDTLITTSIDVSGHLEAKLKAIHCHQTQLPESSPFRVLPLEAMREVVATEFFWLADGPALQGMETDLFAGVRF